MALKLDDRPDNNSYDNGDPGWRDKTQPESLEDRYNQPSGTADDVPEDHPDRASLSPSDLDSEESGGSADTPRTRADEAEASQLGSSSPADDSNFNYKNEGKTKVRGKLKQRRKKLMLLVGAGGGGGIAILLLFILLSSFKAIHFATVIRTSGFATSQLIMRKEFAQIGYENAVLTEDSVRGLSTPERTMFDRLRGVNVRKTLDNLGESNQFKIYQTNEGVQGFEIRGQRFLIDDFAQQFTGKDGLPKQSFGDLTWREKMTVRNDILGKVSNDLSDVLQAEGNTFRTSFFKGFREHFGIRTSKWAQKARDLLGKSPDEAEALTREQTIQEVNGGESAHSTLSDVQQAADETSKAIEEDAAKNLRLRTKDWVDTGLKKSGIENGVTGFEDALSKVSVGVLVATTYCMIHDANNALSQVNPQLEGRAQRFAHDIQTTAEQGQAGDINAEAMGAASRMWDGSPNVPPANNSPLYLEATSTSPASFSPASLENLPRAKIDGGALTGAIATIDDLVQSVFSLGTNHWPIIGGIVKKFTQPELTAACNAVLTPEGQAMIVVGEVAGAVLTAGGEEGFLQATATSLKELATGFVAPKGIATLAFFSGLGVGLQQLVSIYSGGGFSGAETGEDRASTGFIATNYQNATVNRGVAYGRPLDPPESRATRQVAMADMRQSYQDKPFKDRYFAVDNPYSLVGHLAAIVPGSFGSALYSLRTSLAHIGSTIASLINGKVWFGSILSSFGSKAYAAGNPSDIMADYNYFGIGQWGWSTDEINKITNDESYDTIPNGGWVIAHNQNGELDKQFEKCYTPAAQTDVPSDCSKEYLSQESAIRWRLYRLHLEIIDQMNASGQQT